MRTRVRNPRSLKSIFYFPRLIEVNEYFTVFPGADISDKVCVAELNKIVFNSMPNSLSNQAYVQVFYCEYITFK